MNRNVLARAALAAALVVGAAPARAQSSSPPPAGAPQPGTAPAPVGSDGPKGAATAQPGPAAQELARTLVSERSWTAMIDGYAEALSTQISRALQARGEKPADDLEKRVRSQLTGALDHKEGLQLEATELASRFSEAELKTIASFYRSPPGQKLMKELPEMSASVDARIRERLTAAVPKIVENVAPSLSDQLQSGPKPSSPPAQGRTPPKR